MRRMDSAIAGLALAALALPASACATMGSADWNGHNISEVVGKLGRTAEVMRTPEWTTYVWRQTRTSVSSNEGFDEPHAGFDTSPYCLIRWFSVDGNGTIRQYRFDRIPGICGSTPSTTPNPQKPLSTP